MHYAFSDRLTNLLQCILAIQQPIESAIISYVVNIVSIIILSVNLNWMSGHYTYHNYHVDCFYTFMLSFLIMFSGIGICEMLINTHNMIILVILCLIVAYILAENVHSNRAKYMIKLLNGVCSSKIKNPISIEQCLKYLRLM